MDKFLAYRVLVALLVAVLATSCAGAVTFGEIEQQAREMGDEPPVTSIPARTLELAAGQPVTTPAELDSLVILFGECVSASHRMEIRYRSDLYVGHLTTVFGGPNATADDDSADIAVRRCDESLAFSQRTSAYRDTLSVPQAAFDQLLDDYLECARNQAGEVYATVLEFDPQNISELDDVTFEVASNAGEELDIDGYEGLLECEHAVLGPTVVFNGDLN